jgi:peptidoglycan/LPS O-acetylase OafA/YrhL
MEQSTPVEGDGLYRVHSLDGLRGVAASAVLLSHFSYVVAVPHMPMVVAAIPSRLPVLVFFVLSGFVLALPFLGSRVPGTLSFLVRRGVEPDR